MFFRKRQEGSGLSPTPHKVSTQQTETIFLTKQSAEAMSAGESGYEWWRRFDLFQKSVNKINRVVLIAQEFPR